MTTSSFYCSSPCIFLASLIGVNLKYPCEERPPLVVLMIILSYVLHDRERGISKEDSHCLRLMLPRRPSFEFLLRMQAMYLWAEDA